MLSKKLCVCLCAVILSGCSLFSDDEIVKKSPLPTIEEHFKPSLVWSAAVGDGVGKFYSHLHPASQNEMVYAADRFGLVKALDSYTGAEIWRINLSDDPGFLSKNQSALLSAGIAVGGGTLYVGSEHAQLYALNAIDGELKWQVPVGGEVLSTPVVAGNLVLIHTGNGLLQAIETKNGAIKWTVNVDQPALSIRGESAPTIAYGAAIVGSSMGRLNAILLNEGTFIWQQRIAETAGSSEIARLSDVSMTPVVADDIVYAAAYNGNLAAVDLRSGQIIWSQKIGSVTNLVVKNEQIYLADQDDRILAIDRRSGSRTWTQDQLQHRQLTSPALFQNYLVFGDEDGYLHWIDPQNGQLVAQHKVSRSGLLSAPQVAEGMLLVQAKNGKVYSYIVH